MTTICYKDGVLAADSCVAADNIFVGTARKLVVNGDRVAAAIGTLEDTGRFLKLFLADEIDRVDVGFDESFEGVILTKEGTTFYSPTLAPSVYAADMWALGSGWKLALGAMAAGASAEEACRIACEYDVFSSEPVEIYTFNQPEIFEINPLETPFLLDAAKRKAKL